MKKIALALGANILMMVVGLASFPLSAAPALRGFNFTGAWVLPMTTWTKQGKPVEYIILGREAGGRDRGTYDAFGGGRDQSDFSHPVSTAAREFYEESIAYTTLGMNQRQVLSYIDFPSGNTKYIFAVGEAGRRAKNVLYVTKFPNFLIKRFKRNFPGARRQASSWKYKEKDALATVRWHNLKQAISSSRYNTGIQVRAEVIHADGRKTSEMITLRGVFVKMLRLFVKNKPYVQGKRPGIRFYTLR